MPTEPTEIDTEHFGGVPVAAVACGQSHALAVTTGGALYAWGSGRCGATGLGYMGMNTMTPQLVRGALAHARVVRVAAGQCHSCALTGDGRVFAFGKVGGIPATSAKGIPPLLQGAAKVSGTSMPSHCAIGSGYNASHSAFAVGAVPPGEPGFEAAMTYPWHRRRAMLMFLRSLPSPPCRAEGMPPPAPVPAATAALIRAALLLKCHAVGSHMFQFL